MTPEERTFAGNVLEGAVVVTLVDVGWRFRSSGW